MTLRLNAGDGNFLYLFYHNCAKIYGPPQILQKYTSATVAHGVRDIPSWLTAVGAAKSGPLAWDKHSVVPHGVRGLALWATAVAGLLASGCLYNTEIQSKMS
jgi:hypothetical protein